MTQITRMTGIYTKMTETTQVIVMTMTGMSLMTGMVVMTLTQYMKWGTLRKCRAKLNNLLSKILA